MTCKLRHSEKEFSAQDELIHNAEFQLRKIQQKVARGLGERSDEEKHRLQKNILELESVLESGSTKRKKIVQQCKDLQRDLQTWKRKKTLCEKQHEGILGTILEVERDTNSCETLLQQISSSREEKMVSRDVLRIEVLRLRDILRTKVDEMALLEQNREEIVASMNIRRDDLKSHNEGLVAQLRAANDLRHKHAVELGQRRTLAQKIKSKYDMLRKAHNTEENDSGEEHTRLFCLITAAQRRDEVQIEGDKLDSEIKKKEKEIRAMKKTFLHLRERNKNFRLSFSKADENNTHQVKVLEEKVEASDSAQFELKRQLILLQRGFDDQSRSLRTIEKQKNLLHGENCELLKKREQISEEIREYDIQSKQTQEILGKIR